MSAPPLLFSMKITWSVSADALSHLSLALTRHFKCIIVSNPKVNAHNKGNASLYITEKSRVGLHAVEAQFRGSVIKPMT